MQTETLDTTNEAAGGASDVERVVRLTKGCEMEIILHWNNDYVDVSVKDSGTTIDLGLHNENERRELAKMLRAASEDLMDGLEDA